MQALEFDPPFLLRNAHVQTLAGGATEMMRRHRVFSSKAEARLFSTTPGTRVLTFANWQPHRQSAPTVVILHGLTGNANAGYMNGVAQRAYDAGFNTLRVNARNCGGTEELTPTLNHSGLTDDMRAILTELEAQDGFTQLYFGGFSMGGNIALKLAGEWGADIPKSIRGVFAVSPPIELKDASARICIGAMNRFYQRTFLRGLEQIVRKKAAMYPDLYDLRGFIGLRTLREFDERFIAPGFGFSGADDYYHRASAARVLSEVRVPTLVVHARDDCIVPFDPFQRWIDAAPKHVTFLTPRYGGHLGFFAHKPSLRADPFWSDGCIVDFLNRLARA